MKILPLASYQIQNYQAQRQNSDKQNICFGMFKVKGNEEEVLNGLNNLCSKTVDSKNPITIMADFLQNRFFTNHELKAAFEKGAWNEEDVLTIAKEDIRKLNKLTSNKPSEEVSSILNEYLTTGQVVIF